MTLSNELLEHRVAALERDVAQLKQQSMARDAPDRVWLDSDLSRLGEFEPYDWQPGELEAGQPVEYVPGVGVVILEE